MTGVTLNKNSTTLTAGSTETLTATVAPNNATNKGVTWSSSDNSIATVSNGVVTAKTVGNATITATTNDGSYTANCAVTVEKGTGSISYSTTSVSKTYGDAAFTNTLTNTGDGTVSYSSDDMGVATVDSSTGEVTIVGVEDGSATITATVQDSDNYTYSNKTASYTLTVSKADPQTPYGLTATYGQTLANVTLPDGWAWKDNTTSVGNVGLNSFKANYTATSTNYNSKSDVDVSVTVSKAAAPDASTITNEQKPTAKTGDDAVYTGNPIALVIAPSTLPTDYTGVQYSTDGGTTWVDTPTGTAAGDYTVKVKYTSDNYNDLAGEDVAVTITKAAAPDTSTITNEQKPTAKTGDDVVYTGEPIALVTAPSTLPTGYTGVQYSTDGGTTWVDTPTGTAGRYRNG